MRKISLTNQEAAVLWRTLEALVNDDTKEVYIGNHNNPEWERSTYCSESRAKLLREVMEKFLEDG